MGSADGADVRSGRALSARAPAASAAGASSAALDAPPWRLPAIVAVALLVRTVAWLRTEAMMNDGPTFIRIARLFAEGEFSAALAHDFHPLYPLAMVAAKPFFTDWADAGACVAILSGGLAVFALHTFLRSAFDATVAWVGALLLAVHPYAAPFSGDVQSEGLYLALFLSALAAVWHALGTRRFAHAVLAGGVAGLAYLVRPEGIGPVLVGAGMLGLGVLQREWRLPEALRTGAALLLGAGLCMVPYLAAVALDEGHLTLTRKKSVTAIATLDTPATVPAPPAPAPAPAPGAAPSPSASTAAPPEAPSLFRETAAALADPVRHGFRTDHLVLLAFGLFVSRGRPGPRAWFLGGTVLLYTFVLAGLQLSAGYVSMRHVLPPLLPCLGYVALGVPVAGRILLAGPARLAGRGVSPRAALAVGLALLVLASTLMAIRPRRENRVAIRAAAEWLAAQEADPGVVAALKQRDAYYAGAGWVRLPPSGEGEAFVRSLRSQGVDYVVLDGRRLDRYPGLEAGGRLVHREDAGKRWAGVWALGHEGPDAAPAHGSEVR